MKRMTGKLYGILILSMLATSAHAGWLSNLGQRIVNGAANTVQTNISGKVNKTIDDVMDGKLAPQQKNSKSPGDNIDGYPGAPTPGVSAGGPAIVETQESTYRGARGKALPSTGRYEQIDLGLTKFSGEIIFSKRLEVGQIKLVVDEFLDTGYYVICIDSARRGYSIVVVYEHEEKGIKFGFGIIPKKRIFDNGNYNMSGDKDGIMHVVEVFPNTQGHLELTLVNGQDNRGIGQIVIYKIPGPTLK